jgi:TRAP transporter TAXI family solute receptor
MAPPSSSQVRPPVPTGQGTHAFTVWTIVIGLCLAGLVGTYMLFVEAPPPKKIVIATGGKNGAYYQYGQQYAELLRKEGLTVEVRETKGSVENLQLLADPNSGVTTAIVQSGVAGPEDRERLLALGSLYREPLWVFYRGETPLFVEKPPPKKVVIATGGKTGAYYRFGQEYAALLRQDGLKVEVKETKGSVENLQLLGDEKAGVDVAIVQSGLAGPKDRGRLRALGSLYREPLWVFYRGDKPLGRLSELAGKRVGVGPKQSGTYPVARELLKANGVFEKVTLNTDPAPDAATKLLEGELDAAFFVTALDAGPVQQLIKDERVRLLSFRQSAAYQRRFRFLSEVTVPAGLINLGRNVPAKDISLLAPTAMLVVRKQAHATLVAQLLAAAARVHARGDLLSNPGEFPSASYTDLPVSAVAKQFYKTGSPTLPRPPAIDRLSYLEGKRINVGPKGSGTYPVAVQLLKANGMLGKQRKVILTEENVADAAKKLRQGKLDAAFFVAAIQTDYIQELMKDPYIRLMSFGQHEAYHRRFRFLSDVSLPAGLIKLGPNVPPEKIYLVAPTAMLVVKKDMHPALISLLLTTATRIHGQGDELTNPGEFPSPSYTDLPVSKDAKRFYKTGPPFLQRYLPFWLASLVDRLKVMIIPLVVLLMPLLRAAPPLVRWRTRRKIYLWYTALRDIDQKINTGLTGPELEAEIARVRDIEHQVTFVKVPLSYMNELYHLRVHLKMVQEQLEKLRSQH